MNGCRQIILLAFFLWAIPVSSQEDRSRVPLPIFSPFTGTVYEMPKMELRKGNIKSYTLQEWYSDTIYTYPVIGPITLEKLNIPETYCRKGSFPGVEQKTKFAMVLNAQMEVQLDACYEFTLNSDDGSRMWIDEIQVVNNDGGHGMKIKKDTVALRKGEYDAKVWYFQSYPDRFGLIMNSKIIGKFGSCAERELGKKKAFKKIIFDNVYFDTDKYTLKPEGKLEIEKIVAIINDASCKSIKVIGHTDAQGTEQYNKMLSLNRSDTVASAIQALINDKDINFIILGRGETEPVDDNSTVKGRSNNRRVEILLMN